MSRLALVTWLIIATALFAQPQKEPLVEQVRAAIHNGVGYLRRAEKSWEQSNAAVSNPGGGTAIALLALLYSGVPANDPLIQRGLVKLRTYEPRHTYVVGLQTMVFAEVNDPADKALIKRNVDWIIKARKLDNAGNLLGWGYSDDGVTLDNSNSQYAVLGLHAGRTAGIPIDAQVWRSIRDYYTSTQGRGPHDEGGWAYHSRGGTIQSMTIAGLCGLQIVALELNKSRQGLQPDGSASNCGQYSEDDALQKALAWLAARDGLRPRMHFDEPRWPYYNAYGIERAGRLTGRRFLGDQDWYRQGCTHLLNVMVEGSYWKTNGMGTNDIINTSFALLFLSKGRTPVLISKWAYGPGEGWNNKHYDAKFLVEFASAEIFKKQPLAWQVYDARKLSFNSVPARYNEVGNLLQSPIVYINGHDSPNGMTDTQKQMLTTYVEEGGFLLAEACCGKSGFANGFRQMMAERFPNNPLRRLPADHPIWKSLYAVRPDFVALEGIELGCKTVVVFSPQPLAGYWEENLVNEGRGKEAFRLAGNIIAYATGLEMPKERGTHTQMADARAAPPGRGFIKVAQLRHEGDWQPAPRAMPNLMRHLRGQEKLDVVLTPEILSFTHQDLFQSKFLYLHGRGRFSVSNEGLDNLRGALGAGGGMLLADACCGSPGFDNAFRDFAKQLYPDKPLQPIPLNDALYSAAISGAQITTVKVRSGGAGAGFDATAPALEGININGRWAVIYSRFDLGCALEKHVSGECKGHDHDSAIKLASAAVLYLLKK